MKNFVLTSESVTAGHPDKLCDQISDAVVDACLATDPKGGVVAECAIASGVLFLSIRHRRPLQFDPAALARRLVDDAGYAEDGAQRTVMLESAVAPEQAGPGGALDHGSRMATVFGHACDHTPEKTPYAIWAAHRLSARIDELWSSGAAPWLGPDAQLQVAARFEDRRPVALEGVALTVAGGAPMDGVEPEERLAEAFRRDVAAPALADAPAPPTAQTRFVARQRPGPGGPGAHAGLTGRKTPDDCYGSFTRHGGSALSGKDPSRVERVGAYGARQAALTVLAAGLARECEVQLSYGAGEAAPVSVEIDSFGGGAVSDEEISARLKAAMDFRVGAIAERLGLWEAPARRGGRFYRDLAVRGHFGRLDLDAPWEQPHEPERL